jgi:penicillin amidase
MILREVLPVFKAHPENAAVARTLNYLENWDYTYSGKSAAAGIFDMFFLTLAHTVLEDDMGPVLFSLFTDLENIPVRSMHEILRQDSLFFDHRNTPEVETKEQVILKSLETAVAELDKRFGKEPYQWQWDNVHTVTLSPLVFGKAAEDPKAPAALKLIVRAFFNIGPNASPGHGMTLNNAQYNWDRPFQQVLGPSVRRIIDLSNTGSSHSILPAGQSGNPFSIHYSDQHERWLKAQNRIFKHRLTPFEAKYYQRFIPVK